MIRSRLVFILVGPLALLACGDDGSGGDGSSSSTTSDTGPSSSTSETTTNAESSTGGSTVGAESTSGDITVGTQSTSSDDTGTASSTDGSSSSTGVGSTSSTGGSSSESTAGGASQIGDACVAPGDCDEPQFCHDYGDNDFCSLDCVPFDQMEDCSVGSHCILDQTMAFPGVCFPASAFGDEVADACDAELNTCAEDIQCFDSDGQGTFLCLGVCRPALGDDDCAAPTPTCADLGSDFGVCVP